MRAGRPPERRGEHLHAAECELAALQGAVVSTCMRLKRELAALQSAVVSTCMRLKCELAALQGGGRCALEQRGGSEREEPS
jgi:hypothetical protein